MKEFAQLIYLLDSSTKTNDKLQALIGYFNLATNKDKVWAVALFTGRRPKRIVASSFLKEWCTTEANIPNWLFEESYHTVGDLAETIALLIPQQNVTHHTYSLNECILQLIGIANLEINQKKEYVIKQWQALNKTEKFVFNKLLTGGFRIGIAQQMVINAIAKISNISAGAIAHQLMGNWDPQTTQWQQIISQESTIDFSKPYPFYLAYPLENEIESLGNLENWQIEYKWDGIRGQIIKRNDTVYIWSRGEELVTDKFPELVNVFVSLPNGTVLDGEIIARTKEGDILSFNTLQKRIGRKTLSKKILEESPVGFIAYDVLEYEGNDYRNNILELRSELLQLILTRLNNKSISISNAIHAKSWQEIAILRAEAPQLLAEGLMLKNKQSTYQVGRKRGDWWKWKVEPFTIDAVLLYAQKGHGRRSNLFTDYTFAVKDGERLVTFTKAYSGLTDKEFAEVTSFVNKNAIEKFGPVRTVPPQLVFEIAFEGIAESSRHKCGVALRFPRIKRWRHDKTADEINTLTDLKALLQKNKNNF
jgi:DNA ligase 1